MPVGKKAEVADAHKAARQQVEQKPAQELIDQEAHDPLAVAVDRVPPSECDIAICKRNQSAVRDGDPVSVGAKVA